MSEGPESPCPQCGQPLHRWPTLNGTGYLVTCSSCGYEHFVGTAIPEPPKTPQPLASDTRLRQLLAKRRQASTDEWPASLLEQLPDEIRSVLTTQCPNCQAIVARQAKTCPSCGEPLNTDQDAS